MKKIKQHLRVALQSALATFFVALLVVAVAQAATTIGNNITTGTVKSEATSGTLLTADGSTSSTTLAVYQRGSGDLVNVFDSGTEVFTILDGGKIGVGSTTPYGLLSVEALSGQPAIVVGSSTNELFIINSTGATIFNNGGWPDADFTVEGDAQANLLMVDASADRVGIASSTPHAVLSVHALTGQNAIVVGSTTNELFKINASGAVSFNGGGWPDADFTVQGDAQANLFMVDASADRVGIASSTPHAVLSVQALSGQKAISVGSSTNELFAINATGATLFNDAGWADADFTVEGDTLTNLFMIDASADAVGIASSTPWNSRFAVEQGTETHSFLVMNQGSSTPSFVVNGVNGNGRVGVGTTTPSALFSIGMDKPGGGTGTSTPMLAIGYNNTTGTTTIDLGRVCFLISGDNGDNIYMWYSPKGTTNSGPFATSTTSCF